jgi:translation initiation factor IF-2
MAPQDPKNNDTRKPLPAKQSPTKNQASDPQRSTPAHQGGQGGARTPAGPNARPDARRPGQPAGSQGPRGGNAPGGNAPGGNVPSARMPGTPAPRNPASTATNGSHSGPANQGRAPAPDVNQRRPGDTNRGPATNAAPPQGRTTGGNQGGSFNRGNNRPRPGGQNRRPQGGQQNHGHSHDAPRGAAGAAPAVREAAAPARQAAPTITEITIPEQITVRELAEAMGRSPIEVIKTLMNYGIMVPITQSIDFDTAAIVGEELGVTVKPAAQPEQAAAVVEAAKEAPRTLRQRIMAAADPTQLVIRPPVVTVLGHVDHGKTTLLDAIRETRVVEGEAGGITQHVGAYQVERNGRKITFLDTPGHEAFTAMRARGASVTDIAVLVVAADDGVMPQTKEAISHAQAAQVPILVALNKIDKANANPDRVKQELADNGLLVEEYGGDVICVPVSAKMRRGIDDLLESILLLADVEPQKAIPAGEPLGSVIESRLDKTRGPTATLLVQNGTLHVGDALVIGETYGRIRAMFDDKGQAITEAPPSTPAQVLGLNEVPVAGDTFEVVADEKTARSIASERSAQKRAATGGAAKPVALEDIFAQIQSGQAKELNLILKADVQGSIEPICNSLEKLGTDKVRVKLLHQATGNISESDVMLAIASNAIILGYEVAVDVTAQRMADSAGVDIRIYNIIYNLVEDVDKALKGMLEPVFREVVTGHAEVRQVFHITKVGKVAGCYVTDGELARGAMVRLIRNGEPIKEDRLVTLKRYQEDASEVKTGYECGMNLGNFNDFEVGDVIEAFKKERVS